MDKPCSCCPLADPFLIRRHCLGWCVEENLPFTDPYERLHNLGNRLYKSGEFLAAVEVFRAAIRENPHFAVESYFNASLAHVRLNEYEVALQTIKLVKDHCQTTSVSDDVAGDVFYVEGLIFVYLERFDEAEASLTRAKELGNLPAIRELSALKFRQLRKLVQAADLAPAERLAMLQGQLRQAGELQPAHQAELFQMAAQAASELGDYALAHEFYEKACCCEPTAESIAELAEFVIDHGSESDHEIAETWLHKSLSLNGENARAQHYLGRLQASRSEFALALRSLGESLRIGPTDEVVFETAETAADAGNLPLCVMLLERLEAQPEADPYWLARVQQLRRSIGI